METNETTPAILLLHDGELEEISAPIEFIGGINRRGGLTEADRNATWDLVLGTSKRMLDLHTVLPSTNAIKIAVVDGDSKTMRRMLRISGIDLQVRRPVHPVALRLLILYALYRGPEKRRNSRVSVGAAVRFRVGLRRRNAILAELSATGCRLMVPKNSQAARPDGRLTLLIPPELNDGRSFSIRGRVARIVEAEAGSDAIAMTFEKLRTRSREGLAAVVAAHSHGPAMLDDEIALAVRSVPTFSETAESAPREPELPEHEGTTVAEQAVEDHAGRKEQREEPRRALSRRIVALGGEAARVLIGRDLSTGGMRIEPTPGLGVGDILRVALHVRSDGQPLVVSARVRRDDGAAGLALRFTGLSEVARRCLEEMLGTLPAIVESSDSDTGGGVVVSEVVARRAS
jgi:c-di-GMP-binding flagellar brake protein YcgR